MSFSHFFYTKLIKPIFFAFTEPEKIHDFFLDVGHFLGSNAFTRSVVGSFFSYKNESLEQFVKGIEFKNPVGLSAGFDKDGQLINLLPSIGFSFGQIGTITKNPYGGNAKPRLYRLPKSKSIVVNYGLKNEGVDAILNRIKKSRHKNVVLGLSIGRTNSKDTANQSVGIQDVNECLARIIESGLGDLYTINISCPNLFGGESFTTKESLDELLKALYDLPIDKPVFIKMPINLPLSQFNEILDVSVKYGVDGVVIGNLNKNRNDPNIFDKIPDGIKGSLSGGPTEHLSNELISQTYKSYGDKLVIIGVGGIFTAEDAYEKIKNGATLVQLITGLIFEGPQVVGEINKGIAKYLKKDGYESIVEAIGANHRN